jgi:hypothetical protein
MELFARSAAASSSDPNIFCTAHVGKSKHIIHREISFARASSQTLAIISPIQQL